MLINGATSIDHVDHHEGSSAQGQHLRQREVTAAVGLHGIGRAAGFPIGGPEPYRQPPLGGIAARPQSRAGRGSDGAKALDDGSVAPAGCAPRRCEWRYAPPTRWSKRLDRRQTTGLAAGSDYGGPSCPTTLGGG
jgi:hypothetical protein